MRKFLKPNRAKLKTATVIAASIYIAIWASETAERTIWNAVNDSLSKESMVEMAKSADRIVTQRNTELKIVSEFGREEVDRALLLERIMDILLGIFLGYFATCIIMHERKET